MATLSLEWENYVSNSEFIKYRGISIPMLMYFVRELICEACSRVACWEFSSFRYFSTLLNTLSYFSTLTFFNISFFYQKCHKKLLNILEPKKFSNVYLMEIDGLDYLCIWKQKRNILLSIYFKNRVYEMWIGFNDND